MADTRVTCISAQGAEHELAFTALATPDLADRARTETNAWIKRLRLVLYGRINNSSDFPSGRVSSWWFSDLYL